MRRTISVPEAVRRAGCFSTYFYQLVNSGKIRAEKIDGRWVVDLAAFEAWHKEHQSNQVKRNRPVTERRDAEVAMQA